MTHPTAFQKIQAELVQHSKAQSSALPKLKSLIKGLMLPAVLILVCEYLVRAGFIEPYLLPAPSSLWLTLTELAAGDLWQHIWASSWRCSWRTTSSICTRRRRSTTPCSGRTTAMPNWPRSRARWWPRYRRMKCRWCCAGSCSRASSPRPSPPTRYASPRTWTSSASA